MSGQSSISYYNHLEDYGIKCTPLGETCQLRSSGSTLRRQKRQPYWLCHWSL